MLVLGKTADDKGTQLEMLTQAVLEKLGYSELVRNDIRSGGAEIDVSAVHVVPMPGGQPQRYRLYCECKAHQDPQNMSDWMKFLGKIFVEEATRTEPILGCFIALSGVNGNVWGSYDELRGHKQNIRLLQEAEVLEMAREMHVLCSTEQATETIHGFTSRPLRRLEVAYYQRDLYWVAFFDEGLYALLSGQGMNLPLAEANIIGPLVEGNTAAQQRLDLQEESESQQRQIVLRKSLLASIASHGGYLPVNLTVETAETKEQKDSQTDSGSSETLQSTASVVNDGSHLLNVLTEEGWIEVKPEEHAIGFRLGDRSRSAFFAELSRFILSPPAIPQSILTYIESDFYFQNIDEDLVEHLLAIQEGMSLSHEQRATIVQFLRLTPSGLRSVLHPIASIVHHRRNQPTMEGTPNAELLNEHDVRTLFHYIYDGLMSDFLNPLMSKHFYFKRGLREVSHTQEIVAKTGDAVLVQGSLRIDYGMGELDPELGGGVFVGFKV